MEVAKTLTDLASAKWLLQTNDWIKKEPSSAYVALTAGALLAVYSVMRKLARNRRAKPLPGPLLPPAGLPESVKTMEELVAKFGPIFGVRQWSINTLFLCDAESIKEALVGQADVFAGRKQTPMIKCLSKECGIVFIDGPKWQEHRRFTLTALRNFGFGKNITERIIQDELTILLDGIAKTAAYKTLVNPRVHLVCSVTNVISALVFGERCGNGDDFRLLVRAATEITGSGSFNNIFNQVFFNMLRHIPGDYFKLKELIHERDVIDVFIQKKIKEHRATIDWDNERDLIDCYLKEMRKRDKEAVKHSYSDTQLIQVGLEMFLAGMETTSTTLTWAFYLMAKYPDVQRRVQAEIDSVIGDKPPSSADRSKLVYTTAVIHEVERYATLAPFAVPHRTTEDTVLRGYFVPAGTIVTPYLYGAHYNPRVWKKPKEFDPSHFYDEASNSLINTNNLIPFSVGKRACLGESLATQELFVFFAGVLQRFEIETDASKKLPDIDEDWLKSAARSVSEYFVLFRDRKQN